MWNVSGYILAGLLFCSIILTQFYVLPSGSPQPAHLLLLIFSLVALAKKVYPAAIFSSSASKFLIGFFFYVFVLNSIWSIYYNEISFNSFTIYCLYNLMVMYAISLYLYQHGAVADKVLVATCFVGILVLFGIWFAGLGRSKFFPRYNGFFNDPNQMAFWVLCIASIYFLLTRHSVVQRCGFLAICLVLIFATMSRSALVGLIAMSFGILLKLGFFSSKHLFMKALNIVFGFFAILSIGFYLSNLEVVTHIAERIEHTSVENQLEARGYDRVIHYPEHLLFGAGQGLDERFGLKEEVHSTWVGLFFYYGVFGFSLFLGFFLVTLRKLAISEVLICFGPMFYGFSTFGARTPIFWVFLAVILVLALRGNNVSSACSSSSGAKSV